MPGGKRRLLATEPSNLQAGPAGLQRCPRQSAELRRVPCLGVGRAHLMRKNDAGVRRPRGDRGLQSIPRAC